MCLAIPMQLVERTDLEGIVEVQGVRRTVSLMFVPDAQVGEYVLIHVGYAIAQIDDDEARATLELLAQAAAAAGDGPGDAAGGGRGHGPPAGAPS